MNGVARLYNSSCVEAKGCARLERFTLTEEQARFANTQTLFSGGRSFQRLRPGDYVRLMVNGELMMSDTDMEKITNLDIVANAHGKVMIAGLGIGLVIDNLREKIANGIIESIVIYEKYQDVIDLVASRYKDLPLEVRCADILQYIPPKQEKYDTIYFDIWPTIDVENLKEMAVLHQRWKYRKLPGAYMGSWMQDFLRNERKKEQRSSWW